MYNKIKIKIKEFLKNFEIIDPVKHCEVYKARGCDLVDGLLCNPKDCPIRKGYNENKRK